MPTAGRAFAQRTCSLSRAVRGCHAYEKLPLPKARSPDAKAASNELLAERCEARPLGRFRFQGRASNTRETLLRGGCGRPAFLSVAFSQGHGALSDEPMSMCSPCALQESLESIIPQDHAPGRAELPAMCCKLLEPLCILVRRAAISG